MNSKGHALQTITGVLAGLEIAAVDNFAFEGEVSPIVIVLLLICASGAAGVVWGKHGYIAVGLLWVCIPLSHLIKHLLGLPDTLHPNTYSSIALLAGFTFVIASIGMSAGMMLRWMIPSVNNKK